tara:strand:- start:6151 stop:6447 length:297 start_codon:yes stop_codon:yes gene_type:complete
MKKISKSYLRKIALERVETLFLEADKVFNEDSKLADKYVKNARKISMKVNLRLPKVLKRKFCKYCYSYLKPGVNARVRIKKMVVYTCFNCKKYMRFKK